MSDWIKQVTDEELEIQIQQAKENWIKMNESTMIAKKVYYYVGDFPSLAIEFTNGCLFSVPLDSIQGLVNVKIDTEVPEITPSGLGLHWEKLDVDLSVPELLMGVFGTKVWMTELGKKAGSTKSIVKSEAARQNGKKGGLPCKQ